MVRSLKKIIRRNEYLYLFFRMARMWLIRFLGGYNGVAATANFLQRSKISKDLILGAYSSIGPGAYICPRVKMGNYVMTAPNLSIVGDDHRTDQVGIPYIFSGRPDLQATEIGHDVWIGRNVTIRSGVIIGRGALIAMGAIVTKDVEPYSIVAGIPARKIRMRFNEQDILVHDKMLMSTPKLIRYCDTQL
jgi:acetyltransferase-like isoleucine patch superfamily enzyme